jgi:hypothetical protein
VDTQTQPDFIFLSDDKPAPDRSATLLDTPTALPTATLTPLPTATFTPLPTATLIATSTPRPSATTVPATPTVKPTKRPLPTLAPATAVPTDAPTEAAVAATADIYGYTTGPDGYVSVVICKRAGAPCQSVMPPGDLDFRLALTSRADMPYTQWVYYGLSVERDGANVPDMFMFVDAGWAKPGQTYVFGTSRGFNVPGKYVIRSSGCMTTSDDPGTCTWTTVAGMTVTFVIQ